MKKSFRNNRLYVANKRAVMQGRFYYILCKDQLGNAGYKEYLDKKL